MSPSPSPEGAEEAGHPLGGAAELGLLNIINSKSFDA